MWAPVEGTADRSKDNPSEEECFGCVFSFPAEATRDVDDFTAGLIVESFVARTDDGFCVFVEVVGAGWVIDVEVLRNLAFFDDGEAVSLMKDDATGVVPSAATADAIRVKDAFISAGTNEGVSCFIPVNTASLPREGGGPPAEWREV